MTYYSRKGVQVVPCEDCGRMGVASHGRRCIRCAKRKWLNNPDNRERDRVASRAWKAANPVRKRESDQAYRERGKVAQLRVNPDELVYCRECGEQMIEFSPSGICGFCEIEAEEAA